MPFDEHRHPRATDGKFAHGTGGLRADMAKVRVKSRRRNGDTVEETRAPAATGAAGNVAPGARVTHPEHGPGTVHKVQTQAATTRPVLFRDRGNGARVQAPAGTTVHVTEHRRGTTARLPGTLLEQDVHPGAVTGHDTRNGHAVVAFDHGGQTRPVKIGDLHPEPTGTPAMEASTGRRYQAVKKYDAAGKFVERDSGRRYNVVKQFEPPPTAATGKRHPSEQVTSRRRGGPARHS